MNHVSTILGEGLSKYRNKLEVDNGELFDCEDQIRDN